MRLFLFTASCLSIPIVEKATKFISEKYQNKKDINKEF
jgi:hypothetical protein